MRLPFYYGTTKKILVAFATIFDEINIIDDFGRSIRVPLVFSQKEKFIDDPGRYEFDLDSTSQDIVFPKMGMEITGFNYAPERHTNPLGEFNETWEDGEDVMMFNRIPYDITFNLYVGAKKLDDSFKIVEQIFPYFTPELTVRIKDKEDFKTETNIPFILNSSSFEVDANGTMDTNRVILWTLNFTAKAFYYPDTRVSARIRETIINFGESDFDEKFTRFTETVVPFDAGPDDNYRIESKSEEIGNDDQ